MGEVEYWAPGASFASAKTLGEAMAVRLFPHSELVMLDFSISCPPRVV